jgi:hypothetical protein
VTGVSCPTNGGAAVMTEELKAAHERVDELEGALSHILLHIESLSYLDAEQINRIAGALGDLLADKVM